jgi:hypothetical protein
MKALRALSFFFSAGCIVAETALAPKNGQGVVIRRAPGLDLETFESPACG